MYLKILQNFRCLVVFENRPNTPIGHEENFVNFTEQLAITTANENKALKPVFPGFH